MLITKQEQLDSLKKIGKIVANALQAMGKALEPGMTTKELDAIGQAYLEKCGARSAPILVYQFPGHTCISINHHVAHGIPGDTPIRAGDMVNIDVSAELNGFFGDTGASFLVPPNTYMQKKVAAACKRALRYAMGNVKAGLPLNIIGKSVQEIAHKENLTIIENLASHGVGSALHEEPKTIPNYYDPQDKRILKQGMVITIEPFLSNGATWTKKADDDWTLYTEDKYVTAQYEHSMVITKGQPIILTQPDEN